MSGSGQKTLFLKFDGFRSGRKVCSGIPGDSALLAIVNMTPTLTICAVLVGTLWLRATTQYIVEADRLLIRRAGFTWMEIAFQDVDEIEYQAGFFDKLRQIKMYQLGFRKMLRIRKRRGFRYVLLNPRDPTPIIEAYRRFRARGFDRPTPRADTAGAPPQWLIRD